MSVLFQNVSYRYPGQTAGVFDINLELADAELVAVIGASGSGKSTLLKLLSGFIVPDEGRILVDGMDITRLPPHKRELGIVFQSYALFPHMSVWENVAYPLKVRGIPTSERRIRALATLKSVGLEDFAERVTTTLSGGQQQRVALARAIVFRPKALLLDEPLSALDASLRHAMRDEIVRVQQEYGIATLHVTHDQEEALSMASRVAVMQAGRLVQVACPRDLYEHPVNASVAAFVGQSNLWPGTVVETGRVRVSFGVLACDTAGHLPGDDVTVLVRPERVQPVPKTSDAPNVFAGTAAHDRFLGSIRRYDIAVLGGVITGDTSIRDAIEAVAISPDAIRLLPREQASNLGTGDPT
jgi:putative spermidine/putrescine transport system ATP-binding protein